MEDNTPQTASPKTGMSKNFMIFAVVVILLIVGLGGYALMGRNTTKPVLQTATMQSKVSPTKAGMISSIQDALSKSLSLQCDYADEAEKKTLAYIKGGAIRADVSGNTTAENSSVIMKDKKVYIWTGNKGFIMEFDMSDMMKNSSSPQGQSGAAMMGDLEKFKQNCKPAVVDEKLFTPPASVTFTDMSKMMPSGMTMPSGAQKSPTGMTAEQMQQMQKQMMENYKPQTTPGQ